MIRKIKGVDFGYFLEISPCFFFLLPIYLFLFFTGKERRKFKNFRSRRRKIQFIGGRIVAKFALLKYLEKRGKKAGYKEIEIRKRERGQVYAFCQKIGEISLSISHTDGICTAVCGDFKGVGLDVEKENKDIKRIEKKVFCEEEIEKLKGVPLSLLWCVKESVSKSLGTGFIHSPKDIFIHKTEGERFKVRLKGKFLSLFPEFKNKEIEVKLWKKKGYVFAFCFLD